METTEQNGNKEPIKVVKAETEEEAAKAIAVGGATAVIVGNSLLIGGSGASIAHILAVAGSVIGGGMAVGSIVIVGVPAVIGSIIAYKLEKKYKGVGVAIKKFKELDAKYDIQGKVAKARNETAVIAGKIFEFAKNTAEKTTDKIKETIKEHNIQRKKQ